MGSKNGAGVYQAIIGLMPPHDTYIEPFGGSGAILKRKAPAGRSVIIDKSADALALVPDMPDLEKCHGDALAYLAAFEPGPQHGRTLIYADPPYVHATRTSAARYDHELTDEDHRALAATLRRLSAAGVAVMVSGYPSALYDELFAGWRSLKFQAMTRGGVRTECLWFNFEPGAAHWHTHAGRDFTDRQRIKRKAERWARNFKALPPAERQAVLAALLDAGAVDHSQI